MKTKSNFPKWVLSLSLTLLFIPLLKAQNYFTGAISNAWNNSRNWSLGVVPDSTMSVAIDGSAIRPLYINSGTLRCIEFDVLAGGNVLQTGGVIQTSNRFRNTGTFTQQGGTLRMMQGQPIPFGRYVNIELVNGNYVFNDPDSVSLISGNLIMAPGTRLDINPSLGLDVTGNLLVNGWINGKVMLRGTRQIIRSMHGEQAQFIKVEVYASDRIIVYGSMAVGRELEFYSSIPMILNNASLWLQEGGNLSYPANGYIQSVGNTGGLYIIGNAPAIVPVRATRLNILHASRPCMVQLNQALKVVELLDLHNDALLNMNGMDLEIGNGNMGQGLANCSTGGGLINTQHASSTPGTLTISGRDNSPPLENLHFGEVFSSISGIGNLTINRLSGFKTGEITKARNIRFRKGNLLFDVNRITNMVRVEGQLFETPVWGIKGTCFVETYFAVTQDAQPGNFNGIGISATLYSPSFSFTGGNSYQVMARRIQEQDYYPFGTTTIQRHFHINAPVYFGMDNPRINYTLAELNGLNPDSLHLLAKYPGHSAIYMYTSKSRPYYVQLRRGFAGIAGNNESGFSGATNVVITAVGPTLTSPKIEPAETNEKSASDLKVYPNPCRHILNLDLQAADYAYQIFDLQGALVQEGTTLNLQIKTEALQSGTYVLSLQSENGERHHQKFMVE